MERLSLFKLGEVSSEICKPAPNWTIDGSSPMEERKGNVVVVALQASRIGRLRTKLTSRNITGVSFVIVNDQDAVSRSKYKELKKRAPERVPVYQQSANQSDVWELLEGDKDDILIYDWCGHLTFHMVLPYTLLHNTHVENAISATYQGNICNCSVSDQIRGFSNGPRYNKHNFQRHLLMKLKPKSMAIVTCGVKKRDGCNPRNTVLQDGGDSIMLYI
uniref:Selenoprotein P2 n=1 Tax=Fundulus heteroclitus TaxID=8078 RepID=A0A3Q2Q0U6_FUNHE